MAQDDLAIRVQPLGTQWETLGVDRMVGVYPDPDTIELTSNSWGNDKASFNLKRDPGVPWPDLAAWTPVEVEIGGLPVWSGRVVETPTTEGTDRSINVQAEGWQYHLDDDLYDQVYVHTNLGDWRDARSFPTTPLGTFIQAGNVTTGDGQVVIGWSPGTYGASTAVGVILDLGPNSTAASISVDYKSPAAGLSGYSMYCRGATDPGALFAVTNDAFVIGTASFTGGVQTSSGSFPAPPRYIALFLWWTATTSPGADDYVAISGIRVFGSTAWASLGQSNLTADKVIKDRLKLTPLLSTDESNVGATSFVIPEFVIPATNPQTPREAWDAVNAFHNYRAKVDVEKKPVFGPVPAVPKFEVGDWSNAVFSDASANSADDIYNRVIVTGTGPDGSTISQAMPDDVGVPNTSLSTDLSGWFAGSGDVLTRDTGFFNTAPASAKLTRSDAGALTASDYIGVLLTGYFLAGYEYSITAYMRNTRGTGAFVSMTAGNFNASDTISGTTSNFFNNWVPITVKWVPKADYAGGSVRFLGSGGGPTAIWADDVSISVSGGPTIADKRSFHRTANVPINSPLTDAVAQQIGAAWLHRHTKTPFKGSLTLPGHGSARATPGGNGTHPARFLRETGELVRLSHRVDPNTGGVGRDGQIANVRYTHKDRVAQIDLDTGRENIEAFLSRLDIITNSALGG